MNQFSERNVSQGQKPAGEVKVDPSVKPLAENSGLESKALKLNLSVSLGQKKSEPVKETIQLKTKTAPTADPIQAASAGLDNDVINTVTHLVKAATVHPLASSRENRALRNQQENLDSNKEQKKQAVTQATKIQQTIEQEKIQQKTAGQHANAKEGAELAGRAAGKETVVSNGSDRIIDLNKNTSNLAQSKDNSLVDPAAKQIEDFKRDHSRSNSGKQAAESGLAQRNSSIEGERESLTTDLIRNRTQEKIQEKLVEQLSDKAVTVERVLRRDSLSSPEQIAKGGLLGSEAPKTELLSKIVVLTAAETVLGERKTHHRRFYQELGVSGVSFFQTEFQEKEEDEFSESWVTRRQKRRLAKKSLSSKQATQKKKKLTPLERRKLSMREDKARRMRKRSRKLNR